MSRTQQSEPTPVAHLKKAELSLRQRAHDERLPESNAWRLLNFAAAVRVLAESLQREFQNDDEVSWRK
jgi:hypothetical protein